MECEIIQTTKGQHCISINDRILIHEHIFNRFPYWHKKEMDIFVVNELEALASRGITLVFDLTPYTRIYDYYNIIDASPISLACCLGFYTPRYISAEVRHQSTQSLISKYSKSIENGIGSRHIKPAVLKVAAQNETLSAQEQRFFQVISFLSREYKLPIALHAPKGTLAHVNELIEFGANPAQIMAAHIENGIGNPYEFDKRSRDAIEIMKLGAFVQLSDFGSSATSGKTKNSISFVNHLIQEGYVKNLLVSGDSCWRWKDNQYKVKDYHIQGGKHYTYTTDFILPELERTIGGNISEVMLRNNPMRFLRGW